MRKDIILLFAIASVSLNGMAQEIPDSLDVDFGELDELVITAKKDIVKTDGAKLTYDLDEDESSKGQSVLDALKKVPMVQVDGQDNIYIKGSQDFKIMLNGKEDPMLTANASKILKAMPAEAVSKIEVITDPGAKYDAEGTGGFLNLITERKQTKDGYMATVSANVSSQSEGGSLYGRMKYGKVTADANFNYADNAWQGQSSKSLERKLRPTSEESHLELSDTRQNFYYHYYGASLNLSWEPTDRDLFTAGGNLTVMDGRVSDAYNSVQMFTRDNQRRYAYVQQLGGGLDFFTGNASASYKRMLGSKGSNLIFAYAMNYGKNDFHLRYHNEDIQDYDLMVPYQKMDNVIYSRENIGTIDYKLPVNDKHQFEIGTKGIWRHNNADSRTLGGETEDRLQLSDLSRTLQLQDIYAGYFSYNGTVGNWAFRAGLRYEYTYMKMDFRTGVMKDYHRNLNDLAPDASLTYIFAPAINLRLAYNNRIRRPSLDQMNPYEFRITEANVRLGNPDLKSERYQNLSLTYSNFGRILGGTVSLEGSQSSNAIESYTYAKDNVFYETYGNFGHNRRIQLNGFLNCNITNAMTLGLNGDINFTDIKSADGKTGNHGWKGSYGANWNYTGPWKVKYSAYGGHSTGYISLQGDSKGWYWYGLAASRSFLKDDALTLSVNAANFLTKYSFFKRNSQIGDTHVNSTFKNRSWGLTFSISWNFGHLSDKVKETGAKLGNDDTKSTSSGNGIL